MPVFSPPFKVPVSRGLSPFGQSDCVLELISEEQAKGQDVHVVYHDKWCPNFAENVAQLHQEQRIHIFGFIKK